MHPKEDKPFDFRAYAATRRAAQRCSQDEKAAALLIGSDKMYGLLNMTTLSREYQAAVLPAAFLAREDYLLLWQLQAAGPVADGGEHPRRARRKTRRGVQHRGGDSRNGEAGRGGDPRRLSGLVGSGNRATDNGTGSTAVLEAARPCRNWA